MSSNRAQQYDDDLSNLDGLINLRFNGLVPSMSPQPADTSNTPVSIASSPEPTVQEQHRTVRISIPHPDNLSRRPQIPSTNLPLVAPNGIKKPPHTYPELIEYAIEQCGPLTVSQIYSWIMSTFPYFQSIGDVRWKPGIRHTLTTHHLFRKVRKDQKLRGWQWSLVPEEERRRNRATAQANAHWKKQKMQQYEKVLNDKEYNPNAAYQQLQQQIQKQILLRQKLQQSKQHGTTESQSKPAEATPSTSSGSSSNNPQFAVVNTKEFFQHPAEESENAVLALQQDICLSLEEGSQTSISIASSKNHGMLHELPTPSLSRLNDTSTNLQSTLNKLADRIREEPLSVDPSNFSLIDPAVEETSHPNVGLLQIHQPNCEACIAPTLQSSSGHVYPGLWGMEKEESNISPPPRPHHDMVDF